jgi:hypothetical protein
MAKPKPLLTVLTEVEFTKYVAPFLPYKINGSHEKVPFWRVYRSGEPQLYCKSASDGYAMV